MPYTGPVLAIEQNPYPDPLPQGNVTVPTAGYFDSWAGGLGPVEGALGGLGSSMQGIEASRQSLEGPLGQGVSAYLSTGLQGSMSDLLGELGQPNPLGTKIPYTFQIPQLPSQTSLTANLPQQFANQGTGYLNWLWGQLSQWITIAPPQPLG